MLAERIGCSPDVPAQARPAAELFGAGLDSLAEVAARLREQPQMIQQGIHRLLRDQEALSSHDAEWLALLQAGDVEAVARVLEDSGDTGQRLRSGMPFKGLPFVTPQEMEPSVKELTQADFALLWSELRRWLPVGVTDMFG